MADSVLRCTLSLSPGQLSMSKQLNVQIDEGLLTSLDVLLMKMKYLSPADCNLTKSDFVQRLIIKELLQAATQCKLVYQELFAYNNLPSYVKKPCFGFCCASCSKLQECEDGGYTGTHPGLPERMEQMVHELTLDQLPIDD